MRGMLLDISRNCPRKSIFAVAIHLGMSSKSVNAFCHSRSRQRGQCMTGALVNASQTQEMLARVVPGLALGSVADLTHSLIMRVEAFFSKGEPRTDHGSSSLRMPARQGCDRIQQSPSLYTAEPACVSSMHRCISSSAVTAFNRARLQARPTRRVAKHRPSPVALGADDSAPSKYPGPGDQ